MVQKFELTPKGFFVQYKGLHDELMLYMFKQGKNAIVLYDGELHFETVEERRANETNIRAK